jgi:spore maturation protein CgeB
MTKYEGAVLSAYTGYLLCDWDEFKKYSEKLLKSELTTVAFSLNNIKEKLKELSRDEFNKIMNSQT